MPVSARTCQTHPHPATQRPRILHVEDNPTIAALVARFLRAKGCLVQHAANGSEALPKILARPDLHDLIIMDYSMPQLDGFECVKALRANGFDGKIIVLTTSLPHGMEKQFLALGVSRILYKSPDLASLYRVIRDLLKSPETE